MARLLLAVCCLLCVSCASTGTASGVFEQNVGIATPVEIEVGALRVLTLHQFEIERTMEPPNVYIETRWKDRRPFNDELVRGVEAAQVRVFVRARPRSSQATTDFYTVDMKVEQRIREMGSTDWIVRAPSPMAKEFADKMVADMKRVFDVGVHRQ